MSNPKYSICITQYNDAATIMRSLESILVQIDLNFEVIVVDSLSNDGSYEILEEYSRKGSIRLFQEKCSRGTGRQIAFQKSKGEYIIANMDMDDIFAPELSGALSLYHENCEGKLLRIARPRSSFHSGSITIAPKSLISRLGGWRDLQRSEDVDLFCRSAKEGAYLWADFPLVSEFSKHQERKELADRIKHRYTSYRDNIRIGRGDPVDIRKLPIYLAARIGAALKGSLADPFNTTFFPFSDEGSHMRIESTPI